MNCFEVLGKQRLCGEIKLEISERTEKMQRLQNEVASSSEKTAENRMLFDEASERLKNLEKE